MRGFTLVELMLVMVIIGILAAVVGPRFFNRQAFDARMYFEEVRAATRYAQKLSVATGCLTRVEIGANGYRLRRDRNCAVAAANFCDGVVLPTPCRVPGPDGQNYADDWVPLPTGVVLAQSGFPLQFDSQGIPIPAAGGPPCQLVAGMAPAACATIDGFLLNVTVATGLVQ